MADEESGRPKKRQSGKSRKDGPQAKGVSGVKRRTHGGKTSTKSRSAPQDATGKRGVAGKDKDAHTYAPSISSAYTGGNVPPLAETLVSLYYELAPTAASPVASCLLTRDDAVNLFALFLLILPHSDHHHPILH